MLLRCRPDLELQGATLRVYVCHYPTVEPLKKILIFPGVVVDYRRVIFCFLFSWNTGVYFFFVFFL